MLSNSLTTNYVCIYTYSYFLFLPLSHFSTDKTGTVTMDCLGLLPRYYIYEEIQSERMKKQESIYILFFDIIMRNLLNSSAPK